jgi:triacylglycerol lipase
MTAPPTLPTSWNAGDDDAPWPFSRLLFDAARLAYRPLDEGLAGFRDLGLNAAFLDRLSTQAFAANADRDALIAFRGTESFGDIVTDLKLIRHRSRDGDVHAGFWDGYDAIHSAVADFATQAARRGGRIWLTGHSLGGALAVVAAYRLAKENDLPLGGVMTFGQPMVVRPSLAQALYPLLHDRYVCFVNGRDVFPKLVWPYVHFGHVVLYRQGSFQRENLRPGNKASMRRRVFGQAGPATLLESLDDAELDGIIEELEAEQAMTADPDQARMQGMIPWTADHSLDAYSTLVDAFINRTTA